MPPLVAASRKVPDSMHKYVSVDKHNQVISNVPRKPSIRIVPFIMRFFFVNDLVCKEKLCGNQILMCRKCQTIVFSSHQYEMSIQIQELPITRMGLQEDLILRFLISTSFCLRLVKKYFSPSALSCKARP